MYSFSILLNSRESDSRAYTPSHCEVMDHLLNILPELNITNQANFGDDLVFIECETNSAVIAVIIRMLYENDLLEIEEL